MRTVHLRCSGLAGCSLERLTMALGLLLVSAGVWAQAPDKPGGMQSGQHASSTAADKGAAGAAGFDVNSLFAGSCGWCHLKGGREAGKGPQLMNTQLTDAEIISRIRNGKPGQMPAFGPTFTDEQLKAIVAYIRELKP